MGDLVRHLNGPGVGLGRAFGPGFSFDHPRTIGRKVHPGFQGIPGFSGNREGRGDFEAFLIGTDFDLVGVAFQRDQIALVDEPDLGLHAAVPLGHHVGLDGVVLHFIAANKGGGALEEDGAEGLEQNLIAIQFTHFPFESAPDPRQRRISEFYPRIGEGIFGGDDGFEILGDRQGGDDTSTDDASSVTAGGLEGPGTLLGGGEGGQLAIRSKSGVKGGLHLGGGRDVGFPFGIGDFAGRVTFGINAADFEGLAFTGVEDHLLRQGLQRGDRPGLCFWQGEPITLPGHGAFGDGERIEFFGGADVEFAIGHGRRTESKS